jgi:hypothetical protein
MKKKVTHEEKYLVCGRVIRLHAHLESIKEIEAEYRTLLRTVMKQEYTNE